MIDPKTGKLLVGTIPFEANTLLKRCGKFYVVDKNGTQRQVKDDGIHSEEAR